MYCPPFLFQLPLLPFSLPFSIAFFSFYQLSTTFLYAAVVLWLHSMMLQNVILDLETYVDDNMQESVTNYAEIFVRFFSICIEITNAIILGNDDALLNCWEKITLNFITVLFSITTVNHLSGVLLKLIFLEIFFFRFFFLMFPSCRVTLTLS